MLEQQDRKEIQVTKERQEILDLVEELAQVALKAPLVMWALLVQLVRRGKRAILALRETLGLV